MKYNEAKKQIKTLSSDYDINMSDGNFIVYYKNLLAGWVKGNERYLFYSNEDYFNKLPFNDKLHSILSELARTPLDGRTDEKRYYIKIFNNAFGYLNIANLTGNMMVYDNRETKFVKTKFTDKAIEQLKQRDDIPFDWRKVHFKEI